MDTWGWLLVYFFFSTFNSEQADDQTERSDIFFHVVQSVVSFAAAYYLGFIVAGTTYGLRAYFFANVAIVVICGLSLCLFHEGEAVFLQHLSRGWPGVERDIGCAGGGVCISGSGADGGFTGGFLCAASFCCAVVLAWI